MYEYHARALRVIDGDTVVLDVDLGFRVRTTMTVRLKGVNCPERSGSTYAAGEAARVFTHNWIVENTRDGSPLTLISFKTKTGTDEKSFDRYLGFILSRSTGRNLAQDLKETGHAEAWE